MINVCQHIHTLCIVIFLRLSRVFLLLKKFCHFTFRYILNYCTSISDVLVETTDEINAFIELLFS